MNTRHRSHINLRGRAVAALRRALGSRARGVAQTALEIGLTLGATLSAILALNLLPNEPDEPVLEPVPAVSCVVLLAGSALLTVGQTVLDRRATRRWHRERAFANQALDHAARAGADAGRPTLETAAERLEAWAAIDGPWMSAGRRRVILGHIADLRASAERWGARKTT